MALLGICLALFVITTAGANVLLPTLFGFHAAWFASVQTSGVLFLIVVVIEAVIIASILKVGVIKATWWSLTANLLTTGWGCLSYSGFEFLFALLLGLTAIMVMLSRHRENANDATLIAVGVFLVASFGWMALSYDLGLPDWAIYASLVPAFAVSAVLEWSWLVRRETNLRRLLIAVVAANAASYLLLLGFLLMVGLGRTDVPSVRHSYALDVAIPALIRSGAGEEGAELAQETLRARWENPPHFMATDYIPLYEEKFARDLVGAQRVDLALQIYRGTVESVDLDEWYRARFTAQIASWEAQLAQFPPASSASPEEIVQ